MSALETHREYLRLCVEHPQLTSSDAALVHLGRKDFIGILDDDQLSMESERVLWFLSYVLMTMEQLTETTQIGQNPDQWWRAVIKSQIKYNEGLLRVVWPEWAKHYSDDLCKIVEETLPGLA